MCILEVERSDKYIDLCKYNLYRLYREQGGTYSKNNRDLFALPLGGAIVL